MDRTKIKARFDTQKLQNEIFRSKFCVDPRSRFEVLEVEENKGDCIQVEEMYTESAEKNIKPSEKEKQAVVERGHLKSAYRPAKENP